MFEIQVDDLVELKKPHPCGSKLWKVMRVGADIKLECQGCQRQVMLTRRDVKKRVKRFLPPVESS